MTGVYIEFLFGGTNLVTSVSVTNLLPKILVTFFY